MGNKSQISIFLNNSNKLPNSSLNSSPVKINFNIFIKIEKISSI